MLSIDLPATMMPTLSERLSSSPAVPDGSIATTTRFRSAGTSSGVQRACSIDFEGPQRAVDFRLVDAIVEPPALPVGHRLQRPQELLGQERVIVLGVDERLLPLVGIEDRGLRQRIPALHAEAA